MLPPAPPLPRAEGMLDTGEGHHLYWARHGRAGGEPAVMLHGGPGSGMQDHLLALVDPQRFDLLSFDQRGAQRSRPFGALERNGPLELVADIERLRQFHGFERFLLIGGSWGATLALAYAETHPERVARLVLWGTWLLRPADIEWYLYAARAFLPEAWRAYAEAAGWQEGDDLLAKYAERVFHPDPAVHAPAAAAWKTFERQRRSPGDWRAEPPLPQGAATTNMSRIMLHYCQRHGRGGTLDLLGGATRLRQVSGRIVHGRLDLVTPFAGAEALSRHWPGGQLVDCGAAGHTIDQPSIRAAVVSAIEA